MNVSRKDALISNSGADDDFPGSFEVVLSTPAKDRDGDELAIEDWKTPLPDRITFDADHGMSVEKTVGSGVPSIEDGKLIVRGTYSSLPRAQDVRTLVKEGHITTTSVAFMSEKVTKDGKTRTVRELLNGAFVAVPSNRESVVLSAKGALAKAGARHSASDTAHLQAIAEHLQALGVPGSGPEPVEDPAAQQIDEAGPSDTSGAAQGAVGGKSAAKYTAEQLRQMLADGHAIANANGDPSYPIGDVADLENAIAAVGRGSGDHDKIRAYIIRRAKELGASDKIPDNWGSDGSMKAVSGAHTKEPSMSTDPAQLAQAVDAALDEGWNLISDLDQTGLPEPVQQALGCFAAAGVTVDQLLDAMGVDNPDDENTDTETAPAAAAKAAPAADEVAAFELRARALAIQAAARAAS